MKIARFESEIGNEDRLVMLQHQHLQKLAVSIQANRRIDRSAGEAGDRRKRGGSEGIADGLAGVIQPLPKRAIIEALVGWA